MSSISYKSIYVGIMNSDKSHDEKCELIRFFEESELDEAICDFKHGPLSEFEFERRFPKAYSRSGVYLGIVYGYKKDRLSTFGIMSDEEDEDEG